MKNKNIYLLLVTLCVLVLSCAGKRNTVEKLTDYVNPNIGSVHSRWFFYTPAAVPFGMAKLGPSTNGSYGNANGWEAVGYEDNHGSIEGFACFHEFQIGGVMLMPIVGELQTAPGTLENSSEGYRSSFQKENEYATSGFYRVLLDKYNTTVELTATERVGYQRYTFPQSEESYILFDIGNKLGESGKVDDAYIKVVDETTIEGYVVTKPEYVKKYQPEATVNMYFYAKLSRPFRSVKTFLRADSVRAASEIKGVGACLAVQYETAADEQITVKIGQSYTSIENAKRNYETEGSDHNFDTIKEKAAVRWNDMLGRIQVTGGRQEDKVKFYTGLYHALLGRGLANDVNGAYPKNDGTVGYLALDKDKRPTFSYYNTDAIWGGYWNLTQLWALAYPEYYSDWVQSQLLVYQETGWLGDGIANSKYVSGVGTNFTSLAIAAAYNCGIRDFDYHLGYEAALKNEIDGQNRPAGAGKLDVGAFVQRGYCPYIPSDDYFITKQDEGSVFGASHTMEYSFSSYAVAQFAKNLNKETDYQRLSKMASNWENLFDPETELIRPRTLDGNFLSPFDPMAAWAGFQEGNAIQYTFYVPHEPEKLIDKVGQDVFNNRLDSIFVHSQKNTFGGGKTVDAFAGVHALYNHGNQPNLHVSWLFNFSGKPYLTQKWVRTICNEFYGLDGLHGYGYGQDEDQGQLGAWYVMAGMGLFDVKGLTQIDPEFQIGSPIFDRIEVRLNKKYYQGDKFVIEAENNSSENIYVQSLNKNGKAQQSITIPFADVVNGGTLKLQMGSEPNMDLQQ
ncbi:glycoside hydrolase family 92 protein [Sphingobacterium sp. DN00404]|uniref:Glycoside hydrolase family 92 protein n=1 Tax=Sphingobacterium micropteri TaxID=2763501 RepID=A0ABR7YKK4_9SPHI|nr:GH92 family glycosyl hydrolase [Sphingobacterium micropteri]MBD1431860.1 glycoside hydrolase family 92 protein [Sphingobacterium micropteri]